MLVNGQAGVEKHGAFTLQHIQQLYHQQLLQQINEADSARNEVTRLRAQLKVEMDARGQAQVSTELYFSNPIKIILGLSLRSKLVQFV